MTFSKTDLSTYMRLLRVPRGPTLNFRVRRFTHSRDIVSALKRPQTFPKQFEHAPLLVMNGFQDESIHVKLIATMFQNMFPSINVATVDLSTIKRCVLLTMDPVNGLIEFRHYNIKIAPSGISRAAKKLLQGKVPDLSRFNDISDFMYREGNASESEDEGAGDENQVILSQQLRSRGNLKANQSAIRLTEIGPRMTLELVKIEDGLCDGEVLYHSHVSKSSEEISELRKRTMEKKRLKEQRKREQEENVKRKEEKKNEKKKSSTQIKNEEENEQSSDMDTDADDEDDYDE